MTNSKRIAGVLGPALVAVTISESPWVNPHLYDNQIAPVVYLNGTLIFVAGLAVVRVHNQWSGGWPVLVTVMGWFAVLLGLVRMFTPGLYLQGARESAFPLVMEAVLFLIGAFLTFKGYSRGDA